MTDSDPAFDKWMRENHPEILNQICLYNLGAIYLAKSAWAAARLYERQALLGLSFGQTNDL